VSGAKYWFTLGFDNHFTYGQANTTGTVQLGGSTLYSTFNTSIEISEKFTIIVNDGSDAVEGLFKPYYSDMQVTVDGYGTTIDYTGGDGNDVVMTIFAGDVITTGTGTVDIVDADTTVDGESLPTDLPDMIFGNGGDDQLSSLGDRDFIHGGAGNDLIRGGAGSDILKGGRGIDRLEGGKGGDVLESGKAADLLFGGDGVDTFVFRYSGSLDRIADYEPGEQIQLAKTAFAGIGPAGVLKAKFFHLGAEAKTADQHILYDAETGWLLYARRGSETDDPKAFAWIGTSLEDFGRHDILVF